MPTLKQVVKKHPMPEFGEWWEMGSHFIHFMADAIVTEWGALPGISDIEQVQQYSAEYIEIVYGRVARLDLTAIFAQSGVGGITSGEFDALSYAFFRDAYERIAGNIEAFEHPLERERRLFTMRVGKRFFGAVEAHLALSLPASLETPHQFAQLQTAIEQVGAFLKGAGYLRDHFAFHFDVDTMHQGRKISQTTDKFLTNLTVHGRGYAIYEMGYPAILPSAIYLYHTMGEAQHHSSRTIEELFARVGRSARETDDFDPTGYPSDMVVELWEIK